MAELRKVLRCAIYTRKSSEEGLEQEFNSLDAQREAGEAYIKSQAHEGWKLLKTQYDDGGFSGGNMDRPGLQKLMADIKACKIDVVVVYKVDRLSRSLSDFAQLIQIFEQHDVSFVSVTQQFNTTTSMGRLMLNVLLSFAQFEREVTGERIRDKIAASKKKGMWMGGIVPVGYEVRDRKLMIKEEDAQLIRHIFRRYLELGSVTKLVRELKAQGIRTRKFVSQSGRAFGDRYFTRGHLYLILNNLLYLGEIVHKDITYAGEHEAIIERDLWERVQKQLAENRVAFKTDLRVESPSFLKGLLFDSAGNRMSPSHGQKRTHRYRYYVSRAILEKKPEEAGSISKIPAHEIELLVEQAVLKSLSQNENTKQLANQISKLEQGPRRNELRKFINRVTLLEDSIRVEVRMTAVDEATNHHNGDIETKTLSLPFSVQKRGGKTKLIASNNQPVFEEGPKQVLVKAVAQAWNWRKKLEAGTITSITSIAKAEETTVSYISRMLRFAYLAPDIMEAILDGKAPEKFSGMLLRDPLPLSWADQRKAFGFASAD